MSTVTNLPTLEQIAERLAALESEAAELRRLLDQRKVATAMKKSIQQIEKGEGVPAVDFVKTMGRKYGITQ